MRSLSCLWLVIVLFYSTGCGSKYEDKSPQQYHPITEAQLRKVTNQSSFRLDQAFQEAKRLVNRDYPISLVLFKDQTFYYRLENLGDGQGHWTLVDGVVQFKAQTPIFEMLMFLKSLDPQAASLQLIFEDRSGIHRLPMTFHSAKANLNPNHSG
jgi:uncharacterized protein YceK